LESNGSGTGAGSAHLKAYLEALGTIQLTTGTDTTGGAAVYQPVAPSVYQLGTAAVRAETRWLIPVLSDGTDDFTCRCGPFWSAGAAAAAGSNGSHGLFFRYNHGTLSGNLECVSRAAASETTSDSGIAVAADQWYRLAVEVNADASSVDFLVDGVVVATHTTDVPSGSGQLVSVGGAIKKAAGTTARIAYYDLWHYEMRYAA